MSTDTPLPFDMTSTLADRLEAVARVEPDRDAIAGGDEPWSYTTLMAWMTRIASACIEQGVVPGDRVALFFEQQPLAWAAMLAVWRSGGIAVPMSTAQPAARARQMMDDAGPRLVLSETRHVQTFRDLLGDQVPVLDACSLLDGGDRWVWPPMTRDAPAVIMYTSGSDGRPKGVVQTHGNLLQKIRLCANAFGTSRADRFALFATYSVAQGLITALNALLVGATLCPFDVRRSGLGPLPAWLERERITIFVSSASLFRTFARDLQERHHFEHLRLIRIGSERVTPADVAAHRSRFEPSARLVVSYAATETGPISMHFVGEHETFPHSVVPVGEVVEGVTVIVVDDEGREVSDGETGELVVRSAYLSPGYWRDPARTTTAFSNAPGGERDYRTGDLGRIRSGRLEHLGRKGFRVKIRGFRIELEDIETALRTCADVVRVAVQMKPDVDGEPRLVAYVEPAPGTAPTADTLRAHLVAKLPVYMIPSTFVVLDKLPVTEAGKADRTRLPDPPRERPALSSSWALAATPLEATIAKIWSDVLGIERIGVHDAFLSIGGDSLKATRVAARLRSELQVEISLADLLQAETIADIAALIHRTTSEPPGG